MPSLAGASAVVVHNRQWCHGRRKSVSTTLPVK
jgi:hypothetical protein